MMLLLTASQATKVMHSNSRNKVVAGRCPQINAKYVQLCGLVRVADVGVLTHQKLIRSGLT